MWSFRNILFCVCFYVCHVHCEYLTLPEGSECTWKGAIGKCVQLYRCLSAFDNINVKKDPPPICEYQGKEPVICCTDCRLVNDSRLMVFNHQLGYLLKTGQKAHDKCIDFINEFSYPCRIGKRFKVDWILDTKKNCFEQIETGEAWAFSPSGGRPALRNEFPHMALLGYGSDLLELQWLCGGSLISYNFILTAAHCIASPTLGPVKYVALGILRRSDPPETWQRYKVKTIIPHPDYKPPSKYHDIALLETGTPIFMYDVRPACLHVEGDLDINASATGWGALGRRGDLADTLQEVKLEKYKDEECMKNYPPHRHLVDGYNSTTQVCYGHRTEIQDTCQGDSGGPLQTREHYPSYCVYTILGVTSYGTPCGSVGNSGMYTRIKHYVRWIESVVWP